MIAGPTVGPDGNIYVISDFGGLGAFALSPGRPAAVEQSGQPDLHRARAAGRGDRIRSGRLFSAFDEYGVAPSTIFGLSLAGAQLWAKPTGGSDDMFMQQQRQPATGADGSLYMSAMGGANGWSLRRVQPDSGQRALGLLAVALERHVGAQRGAGRLCLLLAKPQLPRFGHPGRAEALDVLGRRRSSITRP